MNDPLPSAIDQLGNPKVVLLQTRKRDGTWVDTPVNIAAKGGHIYFRTPGMASKNKRLRNFKEVRLCPCTWRGKSTGEFVEGEATLLAGDDAAVARGAINGRFPILQRVFVPLTHKIMRTPTLHYEITNVRPLT